MLRLRILPASVILTAVILVAAPPAHAATYAVGPGQPLASIADVPWQSLNAGDLVLIYWRSTPYKEKWVICRRGTAAQRIVVRGVPGPAGELPVIDGNGATTPPALNYWSANRGVIKIGGANTPADLTPAFITIEQLDVRSARPPYTFIDDAGIQQTYSASASSIYVEKGESIIVRNCILRDSGNGFFVASSDDLASRNIMVQANYIYDNGIADSIYQHNVYTAAIGMTFQYNRLGPLRIGCPGNNLKDRSAGLVVRYNWIEGGNRQLDLVDGEDSRLIRRASSYRTTHVYGNVLIEPAGAGNRQIIHYGGDSGTEATYRKGTLYLYSNTVVSTRTDRTTLMRLSSNDEHADVRNNIIYVTAAGGTLAMLDETGILSLTHNWMKPGSVDTFGTLMGTINDDGTTVEGATPGFTKESRQVYSLKPDSACIDAGAGAVAPMQPVARYYVKHQRSKPRMADAALDIGAYEFH